MTLRVIVTSEADLGLFAVSATMVLRTLTDKTGGFLAQRGLCSTNLSLISGDAGDCWESVL